MGLLRIGHTTFLHQTDDTMSNTIRPQNLSYKVVDLLCVSDFPHFNNYIAMYVDLLFVSDFPHFNNYIAMYLWEDIYTILTVYHFVWAFSSHFL